jgi:hypothetical protein
MGRQVRRADQEGCEKQFGFHKFQFVNAFYRGRSACCTASSTVTVHLVGSCRRNGTFLAALPSGSE